jgi:hypothetical protein
MNELAEPTKATRRIATATVLVALLFGLGPYVALAAAAPECRLDEELCKHDLELLPLTLLSTNPLYDHTSTVGACIGTPSDTASAGTCLQGPGDWIGGESCYEPWTQCTRWEWEYTGSASAYKIAYCMAGSRCETHGVATITRVHYADSQEQRSTVWCVYVKNGVSDKSCEAIWPSMKRFESHLVYRDMAGTNGRSWAYVCFWSNCK